MKKYILLASILIASILCGCSGKTANIESLHPASESAAEADNLSLPVSNPSAEKTESLLTSNNMENSIRLLDLMATDDNKNYVFSPLSLNYALGLVAEGASGETKEEINTYLGTENYAEIASSYMQLIKEEQTQLDDKKEFLYIENPDEYNEEINIANSLWVNQDNCELLDDYKKRAEDLYRAKIDSLSFSDTGTVTEKINSWCNEETHGMIPEIFKEDDLKDPLINIVLANALYFESPWREKWFLKEDPEDFTFNDGSKTQINYLTNTCDRYYENKQAIAFGSYYSNGRLFIGIRPKEKGSFTLEDLCIEDLLKNEKSSEYDIINGKMPELDFESEYSLKEPLSLLGVTKMFDPGSTDLDKIAHVYSGYNLYIGSAKQKAKIELNEKGTRAAAVTAMIAMETTSLEDHPKKEVQVYLDRPYAFLIYDEEQQHILFMGKVYDPSYGK